MWFKTIIVPEAVFNLKLAVCYSISEIKFCPLSFLSTKYVPTKFWRAFFLPAKQKVWPPLLQTVRCIFLVQYTKTRPFEYQTCIFCHQGTPTEEIHRLLIDNGDKETLYYKTLRNTGVATLFVWRAEKRPPKFGGHINCVQKSLASKI